MLKIIKIIFLLALAWLFLNVGPLLFAAIWEGAFLSKYLFYFLSGRGWYWGLYNASAINIFAAFAILIPSLFLWLRRPSIRNASILVAIGPAIGTTSYLYLDAPGFTLVMLGISGLTVLGGQFLQRLWDERNMPGPDPYAPMPTYHH